MTSVAPTSSPVVLEAYRELVARTGRHPHAPGSDELLRHQPGPDPVQALAETLDSLGPAGLQVARTDTRRFVQDDGITYGHTAEGLQARKWILDPLPVILAHEEWSALEAGLRQRARLLDAVLTDFYGERRLLHERIVPAPVLLANPDFIRQADGIRLPAAHQLVQTACDLARAADGSWVAFADRTQAPSGAGYAMANRRITSRVMAGLHRGTGLARLRGFFHTMSAAIEAAAPPGEDLPRTVLLSPGPGSETAFDQAFLATLLGIPLVEADDLTSRSGRIWLRASDRLEPVDVIVRRVDSQWLDPLELRPDSQLGLPGLIDASRRQQVSLLNPVGSAVVESPALLPYLAAASEALLGEPLKLPTADTFWCGDDAMRGHVLARLEELIIKPVARGTGRGDVLGWRLSAPDRDDLRRRIEAEPWQWCGQEPLAGSTAPTVTPRGLEPRRLVLRTFAVADDGGYHVMPGGLARVAANADQVLITNMSGALAKDVWVLQPDDEQPAPVHERTTLRRRLSLTRLHSSLGMVPRVADNLYWVGRYAERAESTARLLAVADDLVGDYLNRPKTTGAAAMAVILEALTHTTGRYPGFVGAEGAQRRAQPLAELRRLVIDDAAPGSLGFAVQRLVQVAQPVRDQLSLDTWIVLSRLQRTLSDIPADEAQLQPQLARMLESLLALAGIMTEGMMRDAGWAFIDAGTRMERALQTVALLAATVAHGRPPVIDGQVNEAVLQAGVSIITHRRRASFGHGPASPAASAVDLLLLDRTNPRSVAFQLDRLVDDLSLLGDEELVAVPGQLSAELRDLHAETLSGDDRSELASRLVTLDRRLRELSDEMTVRHFRRKPSQHAHQPSWEPAGEVSE